ncbi:hypothetical protein Zmor_023600 [Zophobas morio]|uniref:Uncharacterized protein n=1 Tax=Zophobas morio TaxID=2755281 RepID=A0AA38I0B3_9CUCU|nr:hypothetical protein Zmor_023600 [Zophobas morio]
MASSERFFNTLFGMPSGPGAFLGLRSRMISRISRISSSSSSSVHRISSTVLSTRSRCSSSASGSMFVWHWFFRLMSEGGSFVLICQDDAVVRAVDRWKWSLVASQRFGHFPGRSVHGVEGF